MKSVHGLVFGFLVTLTGCATKVGVWDGGSRSLDEVQLERQVEASLAADAWIVMPDESDADLVVEKNGPGGQQTWAKFEFVPSGDGGSSFRMLGLSHHSVNWLTFGILGLSMQNRARQECAEWVENWTRTSDSAASPAR